MGISSVTNSWLNRLYKILAILLVLFAVLISALRLFLPYAHHYHQDYQDYINNKYQSNIIIGSLSMGWQKQGPTLIAENVSLLQTDSAEVFIKAIDIKVDFWRSLLEWRIISHDLTLSGAKILFDSNIDNVLNQAISDDGDSVQSEASLLKNFADLLLQHISQFSLENSQIIYRTQHSKRTFLISQLSWNNKDERHFAMGDVIVDGLTSNNLKMRLDVEGLNVSDMKGVIYLQGNQLNITPWLDQVFAIESDKTHSSVNFDAWLTIENGVAQQLQVALGDNEVSWQNQDKKQFLNLNQGQIFVSGLASDNDYNLHTKNLKLKLNQQQSFDFNIEANKKDEAFYTYISHVDLSAIKDILPLFSNDKHNKALITKLNVSGAVNELFLHKSPDNFQVVASLNDITSNYVEGIPGIEHVFGQLLYDNKQLQVSISAENGELNFDKHFKAPFQYKLLKATFNTDFKEYQATESKEFSVNNIELFSDELTLSADVGVIIPKNGLSQMSLSADINNVDVKKANLYYPELLMGEDLIDYLNNALLAGEVSQAQVLFNGPLAKFPFEDQSGIFTVNAELTHSTFKFAQDWPAIEKFAANLNFTNNGMLITGREGQLSGLNVSGVEAGIKNLTNEQILTVAVDIKETSPDLVTKLMLASPLADTVGETLTQVVIDKPITGRFDLTLPLNSNDQALAKGHINFKDNLVSLQSPEMNFTQVNGQLSYHNDQITAQGLSLKWQELPLSLSVKAQDEDEHYLTNLIIEAQWLDKNWQTKVPDSMQKYASGQVNWQGDLSLFMAHNGGFSYQFDINSNLEQTQLALPAPYAKSIGNKQPLIASVIGQKNQSIINANLGKQLSFYGVLNHDDIHFSQAHLILGDEQMLFPTDGFHITTKLAQADFFQWQPFVSDILDSLITDENDGLNGSENSSVNAQTANRSLLSKPERIRGSIGELKLAGEQSLTDVTFNLLDKEQWWQLQLNAKEARTEIKFLPDWLEGGIEVNADFIHLANLKMTELSLTKSTDKSKIGNDKQDLTSQSSMSPLAVNKPEDLVVNKPDEAIDYDHIFKSIPPIRFNCASCKLGSLDLGNVVFDVKREGQDLIKLNRFFAKRGKTKVAFDAQWMNNAKQSSTNIVGLFDLQDLGREIEKFGFTSDIKDSGAKSDFNLNWQGAPFELSRETLNGDLSIELDDGYLVEVPDKARIFSILSLQSMVRKLTLDFRDIFSDGMFYSEIKGNFDIKDGVLYTDNTRMKGAAGDLSIKGNIELAQEILDYRMSYKPNYTSSVPAIAWIATLNPVVFLMGIALDEAIISKVWSELNYEITGTIDDPVLKQVNRKSQNISVGRSSPPQIIEIDPEKIKAKDKISQLNEANNKNLTPSDKKVDKGNN